MASEKQIRANRQNALKSTGPKTPAGKATVSLNATRHGLLSKEVLLPIEDGDDLVELGERLRHELRPMGELDALLVDRIIAAHWRLRRLGRVEAGVFAYELYGELKERTLEEVSTHERTELQELAGMYDTTVITDEPKHRAALSRAEEMKAKQNAETATLGRTFIRDAAGANAFSKLSRYETAIERSLYRALQRFSR